MTDTVSRAMAAAQVLSEHRAIKFDDRMDDYYMNDQSAANTPAAALASLAQQQTPFLLPLKNDVKPEEEEDDEEEDGKSEPEHLIYVNPKQYDRIMRRRENRAKMEELCQQQREKKGYIHESRHKHAMRRKRGPSGRFLTKAELEVLAKQESSSEQLPPVSDEQLAANAIMAVHQATSLSAKEYHHDGGLRTEP